MLISLLKNGKIYNTKLPSKINGSFWVEDKDNNGQKRNLINIESKNNQWILKSNYETVIVSGNQYMESVILEEYTSYELRIKGEKSVYLLYCSPTYDNNRIELEAPNKTQIIIGSLPSCTISYNNKYIAQQQCILVNENGIFYIKNLNQSPVLYVNNVMVTEANLKLGDVVFIMGLKIIICKNYIIINNPRNLIKTLLKKREPLNVNQISDIDYSEDTEIKLYEKQDYFFRMPRFRNSVEEETVSIDPPPEQEKEDDMPLAYTLGPMITMGITSMVTGITSITNVMEGTQTFKSALPSLITCLAMLASMMIWPFLQKMYTKKQRRKREKIRKKKYNDYIDKKREYIKNIVSRKRQALIENNIELKDCVDIIVNRRRNLWERKIEHDDFLNLRLGIGNVEPYVKVQYPEEHFSLTENNLREVLEKLGQETRIMENVPITINFTNKYLSAFVGKKNLTSSFIKALLIQIMTFHSYEDLKIIVMTSEENKNSWHFLLSLPYLWDDDKTIRFFSTNVDEANQISTYLENYFSNRKYEDGDTTKIKNNDYKSYSPYFLILTDDYQSLRNIEIIKDVLSQKINLGFGIMFIQERLLGLPNECTTFISVDEKESGIFENELTEDKQQTFKADFINDINVEKVCRVISNIPIEMAKDRFALPNKLGFLEMFNVGKIEQLNILNRWRNNNPIVSLQAPVGVDTNGELFKLDLHEKFHGPHGLVAGMTGSGKSEFIITYILSMAINYNPEEVSFVLIDYKGGGLAGAFENKETGISIPHLSGTITNLDVNDMNRSLASIQSELRRRQRIFNDARQNLNESTIDIYKYQKLRREGKVKEAIPHLFIISDEFAELKTQQPEFMEQLISIARIGRSLGVHLILATQKPSGVVDDQIWSNTKFRVCLKVQDKSDSIDMIKCPDAASLHNVGRFYLQVGYNEFFALGQSAYAGVSYQNTDKIKKKIDTNISFINNVGYVIKNIDKEEQKSNIVNNGEELSNIVTTLYNIGKEENMCSKKLWLDRIPDIIYISDLERKYNYKSENFVINPVIGEYDDPSTQSQHLLTLPLSLEGNTIIYGAAGTGKDDLLSSIIYSTIMKHSPDEVNFYIVDCGAETLKMYENFSQIGDVLLSNETEKISNLFKMINEELLLRKKLFANYGGNYKNYIKQSGNTVPNIVVIINLYEAFDELYPDYQDEFNRITREGLKYGIIFILSTSGVNFVRYKLKQNFKQNIVLQLNDESDYMDVVGNTHGLYPSKIKGRGLIKFKNIFEFQTASFKDNGNCIEFLKRLSIELNSKYKGTAKKVPILPKTVNAELIKNYKSNLIIPVGIEKQSLKPALIDYGSRAVSLILSNDQSSLESFVPEFINMLEYNNNSVITIIDSDKLFEDNVFKSKYVNTGFEKIFDSIINYSNKAYEIYKSNDYDLNSISNFQNLVVIIVGFSQFKNKMDSEHQSKIEEFMTTIKDLKKIDVIIIDTIDSIKQFEYESWFKAVVQNNFGLWIGDGITEQYTIKLSKNPRTLNEEIGSRFGYTIKKGIPTLIKLLSNLEEEEENDK